VDARRSRIRGPNLDAARKDLGEGGLDLFDRSLRFHQPTLGVEQQFAVATRQAAAIVVSVVIPRSRSDAEPLRAGGLSIVLIRVAGDG
jgi:hypothetical protein